MTKPRSTIDLDKRSTSDLWQTPHEILAAIRSYATIWLDLATDETNPVNATCFYSPERGSGGWMGPDGLRWNPGSESSIAFHEDHVAFLNPPYGPAIGDWLQAIGEWSACGAHLVALLPVNRTETAVWQKSIARHARAITFLRKRVIFVDPETGEPRPNNRWANMLVLFGGDPIRWCRSMRAVGTSILVAAAEVYHPSLDERRRNK